MGENQAHNMGSHDSLKAHHIMGTNLAEKNQQQGIEEYKESPNGVTGEDVLHTAKEMNRMWIGEYS